MLVIAGYQLPNDNTTALTRSNLNLMGVPTVTIQDGEVIDRMITDVDGSKIVAGTVPLSALTSAAQSRVSGGVKNFVPNPQFNEWSNGTSIALQPSGTYNSSSGHTYYNGGSITGTVSRVAITPATSDTLLREAKYWYNFTTTNTGATQLNLINFNIPNARSFSGQQVAFSFVSQLNTGTLPTLSATLAQNFGTGGSPSSAVYATGTLNAQPSGSVALCYCTFTVPSVAGKTFGTNGDDFITVTLIISSASSIFSVSIANMQLELGTIATTFENSLDRPSGQVWSYPPVVNGRLTLISGTPVMSSNVTSTTLYFTPYLGNLITLPSIDGTLITIPFTETSISLAGLTASTVYDVFGYLSGGILTLATTAWTNTSTRATALVYSLGRLVKSGSLNYLYLGSFSIGGTTGQTEFIIGATSTGSTNSRVLLWNYYNRKEVAIYTTDDTNSWTYATSTWRSLNAGNVTNYNRVEYLVGVIEDPITVKLSYGASDNGASSSNYTFSVGLNSTSSPAAHSVIGSVGVNDGADRGWPIVVDYQDMPPLGYSYIQALEKQAGAGTVTVYGDNGGTMRGMLYMKTSY